LARLPSWRRRALTLARSHPLEAVDDRPSHAPPMVGLGDADLIKKEHGLRVVDLLRFIRQGKPNRLALLDGNKGK